MRKKKKVHEQCAMVNERDSRYLSFYQKIKKEEEKEEEEEERGKR